MNEDYILKWEETLVGEALLLAAMGRLLYRYPEDEEQAWIASLFDEKLFLEVPYAAHKEETAQGLKLLQGWAEKICQDGFFERIQSDYTRLFIGPGKVIVPPWESVYFSSERLTFQQQTLEVRTWYQRFGVEPEKIYKEPDDHIGLEISFIAHLAKLALQALEEQNEEEFNRLIKAQEKFLAEHLLRWGPYWCTLVVKNANTEFYKGLALLTQGALLTLGDQFGIKTSKEVVR